VAAKHEDKGQGDGWNRDLNIRTTNKGVERENNK